MGRRKGERRLVDPVFKVADASMADLIDLSVILVILIRNCLALTYPVEEKMGKGFSRRNGLLNIFEINTQESSSTRRNLPGKRGGWLSFCTGKKQNSISRKAYCRTPSPGLFCSISFVFIILHIFYTLLLK